jgi:AcrR family transcriptional regulator
MNARSKSEPDVPSLRERIRETTVQAILGAAEAVFAEEGLHAGHMGEIASRAGVSVGTLYNHFADREALLAGLLEARRAAMLTRIDATLREVNGKPFRERLRALLTALLRQAQDHQRFFQILLQSEIGRYQQTFPSACHSQSETMREIYARIDKLMKQGVKDKEIRAEIVDLAPMLFMGMVRTLSIRSAVKGIETDFVGETERLLEFFLSGAGTGAATGK